MDSPVRQQQKRNDYQRHKLFRKMKRRLKAKKEQEKELAEKELRRKLRMPKYADGKEGYPNLKKIVLGDDILPLYERYIKDGMTPEQSLSSMRRFYDMYMRNSDVDYESFYEGELPAVTIKPDYNKKYDVKLVTHYPSLEWPIGHSEILTPGGNIISADFDDKSYDLLLNNCSDATRLALGQAFGSPQGWHLINTPNTVKSFAELKLGGKTEKDYPDDVYQYGEGSIKNAMKGADITHIPATMKQLQTLANFAHKLYRTGKYADGKPAYKIRTNDGELHNFSFDKEGNTVLDNGVVGSLLLDDVIVRPGVDVRKAIERRSERFAKQSEMIDITDPLSKENYGHGSGALESVYPEFDLIGLYLLLGKPLLRLTGNYLWYSQAPVALYFRYPIGKIRYGLDAKFPTLYRKFKGGIIQPNGDVVELTNPNSRFSFVGNKGDGWSGQKSPVITNMSYGNSVRSHSSGNWDSGYTLAFPGNNLLGKRVISTEPSDIFTYGSKIAPKTKNVTLISGDPTELLIASQYGMNTATSPELQVAYDAAKQGSKKVDFISSGKKLSLIKEDYSKYAKEMRKLERLLFGDIRQKDVDFMNFVLRPEIEGKLYDKGVLLSLKTMPDDVGEWIGNSSRRGYLYDNDEFGQLIYDPQTPVESLWRSIMGIDLSKRLPQWLRDLYEDSPFAFKNGKAPGIHIKPENRGKFTALKKRTGHSASWFKAHGTPALKKMATFALNARKWKKK